VTEAVEHIYKDIVTHLEEQLSLIEKSPSVGSYEKAIQSSLKAVDGDLDRGNFAGGATATLVLIDTKQNLLVEADLGDSHIVFADHSQHSGTIGDTTATDNWNIKALSTEHLPDDPEERKRIEKAGGEINYRTDIARIGAVSMSRALGDLDYKLPRVNRLAGHDLSDLPGVETGLAPGKTATNDLVSNEAHFSTREFNGQSLILLASDGVGNAEGAKEYTEEAVRMWTAGQKLEDVAHILTKRAGELPNADNCTVLLVVLDTEGKGGRRNSGLDGPQRQGSTSSSRGARRNSISNTLKESLDSMKELVR
jgi:serine/threonine protein phosphatase PrpC